jgi:hypothetical protein
LALVAHGWQIFGKIHGRWQGVGAKERATAVYGLGDGRDIVSAIQAGSFLYLITWVNNVVFFFFAGRQAEGQKTKSKK